jgi:hypothetical protein
MRLFYGMIDSTALNAFVIFTKNAPNLGENKKDKRQKFLKLLALALIIPHGRQRLEGKQTLQDVKQVIRSCVILPAPSLAPSTTHCHSAKSKKCYICFRLKDKIPKFICNECNNFVCEQHSKRLCNQCQEKKLDLQIMTLYVK